MKMLFVSAIDVTQSNASRIHFFSIIQSLSKKDNIECHVIFPAPPKDYKTTFYPSEPNIFYKPLFNLKKYKLPNSVSGFFHIPYILYYIKKNNIKFIYTRMHLFSFILHFFINQFTQAVSITEHNGWIADESISLNRSKFLTFFLNKFQIWDAYFAKRIRVVVPGLKSLLLKNNIPESKIFCLGNGTDINIFFPLNREAVLKQKNLDPNLFYIGFIGNLVAWQGIEVAIKAMPNILAAVPNACLLVAGNGPLLDSLKKLCHTNLFEKSVIFLGNIEYEEANLIINTFDIAIAPFTLARNEKIGLSPLKIRDYAAAGRAILASNIKGIKETNKMDWLEVHEPDNYLDFAERIIKLFHNKNKLINMKKEARNYALKFYDWDIISSQILKSILEN